MLAGSCQETNTKRCPGGGAAGSDSCPAQLRLDEADTEPVVAPSSPLVTYCPLPAPHPPPSPRRPQGHYSCDFLPPSLHPSWRVLPP